MTYAGLKCKRGVAEKLVSDKSQSIVRNDRFVCLVERTTDRATSRCDDLNVYTPPYVLVIADLCAVLNGDLLYATEGAAAGRSPCHG